MRLLGGASSRTSLSHSLLTLYSHLLDKIQAIGKAALAKKRGTINGEPIPAPIKRRLLV